MKTSQNIFLVVSVRDQTLANDINVNTVYSEHNATFELL